MSELPPAVPSAKMLRAYVPHHVVYIFKTGRTDN